MAKKTEEPLLLSFTIIRNHLLGMLDRVAGAFADKTKDDKDESKGKGKGKVLLKTHLVNSGPWGEIMLIAIGDPLSVVTRASSDDQSGALIHCEGACVLQLTDLRSVVGAMPDDLIDVVVKASGKLTIAPVGRADKPKKRSFTVYTLKAEDHPPVPVFPDAAAARAVAGNALGAVLDRVKYAASDDRNAAYSGVLLIVGGSGLTAVGTDGYVMAVSKLSAELGARTDELLLPRQLIAPTSHLAASSQTLSLTQDEQCIYIETESTLLCCRRSVGAFPVWRTVIDTVLASVTKICSVDSLQLGEAVRAVSTLFTLSYMTEALRKRGGDVRVIVKDGLLRVTTTLTPVDDELAGAGEDIDVSREALEIERLVGAAPLQQTAAQAKGLAELRADPKDPEGPLVLVSADDSFTGVVMSRRPQ